MKKLIAMIGAVAMSFGLFAASPASFTISFEEVESEKGVDTTSMLFTPPVSAAEWAWKGDQIPLKAYGTETKFAYGTDAYARRDSMFDGTTDNANYLSLSTGNDELTRAVNGHLYLDQLVKFTGFEDPQTNLVAGTKIAVWMSEFENDDESTTTNLYVTVGKVTDDGVKQVALQIKGDYKLDTWYRLSIKSLGGIYTSAVSDSQRAGFLIYINGQQAEAVDAEAETLTPYDREMDGIARGYMAKRQLFTAIDATDATFNTVGYQGIGAVDDIILDDVGPAFCQAIDVQITFPVDDEGNPSVEVDYIEVGEVRMNYPCAVPAGTLITVYFKAVDGKKIMSTLQPQQLTVTANNFTIDVSDIVVEDVVAKKNGTVDVAESELYMVLDALVENDTVETISTCNVTNGEAVTLYNFTPNTTITATAAGWDVFVGNYDAYDEEGGVVRYAGMLTAYADIDADFALNVGFEDGVGGMFGYMGAAINGQLAITNGQAMTMAAVTVGDGALLKAANFTPGAAITLAGTGKFVTQTVLASEMADMIVDGNGNAVVPTAEAGWYTYALSDVPPEKIEYVTFTVTYDTAKVENVTVKTNGADVVNVEGVYTVESNAVVTVAATAKTGYQNVTITGDNVKVDAGVFTADKASSVITIAAEEIPPAYDITFATVENGTLETSVTNGIAAGTTVTVIATPATGYECTQITTNGTAITGKSFEMPADGVKIGAAFTLQPVDPETPKNYDSKEAADAAADAINANKTAMIKTPDGADAADYTKLFTAVVTADNAVVVELNEGGTNALKAAAATIKTAVANKLGDIAAAAAGGNVSVKVTEGVQNGFWYGVAATADLTTMGSTQPTKWVQAKNGSVTIQATKPATGNAAFFQTRVKVK